MERKDTETGGPQVNPNYAIFQIAKALTTAEQHEDHAARERAEQRISRWTTVLKGILDGSFDVGSRTPLEGIPTWATLEVITGGFTTGALLAGGSLLDHEIALLMELPPVPDGDARRVLNGHYLTEQGLTGLQDRLRSGRYDVGVPEEGALLVVAWLVENGYAGEARTLLEELGPYFPKLRFYPTPLERPRLFGSRVFLWDVGSIIDDLRQIEPNQAIITQKEAIQIWIPLYDQIVALFLETVEGEPPWLRRAPNRKPIPTQNRSFPVEGGWPCQRYPDGWHARAQRMLDDYASKRKEHTLGGKPDRAKESFPQLREYLRRCIHDPKSLNGRDVGRIRLILARYISKRDAPSSEIWQEIREQQVRQVSAPTFHEVSRVVTQRLQAHPKDDGLEDPLLVTQPVTIEEAQRFKIEAGTSVPVSLQKKVQRCLSETVDALVERGVITSGETLARVLPPMTSGIRAAGITDPTLRQLYAAVYRAFRSRRSLLLLNLESQVKIDELPWVAAIDRFRQEGLSARELARQTLEEIVILTIVSFPHMILPNKLLQELRALAKEAELPLPLVDEIAADIFMGDFSGTFLQAARKAADQLEGTLYATYYGIDYQKVREIPDIGRSKKSRFGRKSSDDSFAGLCSSRAGVTYNAGYPAVNGMIIEQQQILTTQNLAVVFGGIDLADAFEDRLEDLAQRCFAWICHRQQVKIDQWHARLIVLKNTAYAWRQMVFYLALLTPDQVQIFLSWADEFLLEQEVYFQIRFRPALRGLVLAAEGQSLDGPSATQQKARRFLGWSEERHWLLS